MKRRRRRGARAVIIIRRRDNKRINNRGSRIGNSNRSRIRQ